jgi:membrane-bound ClpP family serine protease
MDVLRGVLYFFAGLFVLVPLVLIGIFKIGLITLVALVVGLILAGLTFQQARKFNVQASESQSLQLEQIYRSLAQKGGGTVALSALLNATGQPKVQLERRMRELVGRGICELDFSGAGEVQYKLTPGDEARAQLSQFNEK